MIVSDFSFDRWHRFSDRLAVDLNCLEGSVLPFLGMSHGLCEVALSLAQTFSHKMSIGIVASPCFERLGIQFSRMGYRVQVFDRKPGQDLVEWSKTLNKDTLFVLGEHDHYFTGELYELAPLSAALNEARIFQIVLSHGGHFYESPAEPSDYRVDLRAAGPDAAVAFLGSRVKLNPWNAPTVNWDCQELENFLCVNDKKNENKKAVEAIETSGVAGSTALFDKKENPPRLYDRALLHWSDVDGFALVHELAGLLGFTLGSPGRETRLEAASLCRWTGEKNFAWLKAVLGERVPQGLVVISAELLNDRLMERVEQAHESVLRKQG